MNHHFKTGLIAALISLGPATTTYAVTANEIFPEKLNEIVLDGQVVRKGTIGATFINALQLDKLLLTKGHNNDIEGLIKDQRGLGSGLKATHLFETMPIIDWLKDNQRPGRIMIAVLALQECPDLMTAEIRNRLKQIQKACHPLLKAEIGSLY
ncbi:MAG: hypothetical protein KBE16_08615 [Alphaproteobacteria bacterium]|nr:hypothetical protein [Alphaproteobacteria bacterium]MBP9877539.1 hypothetical protein [Alphaproteobacteria bacterium]